MGRTLRAKALAGSAFESHPCLATALKYVQRWNIMGSRNLTAYGLYTPELCKNVLRDFSEDDTKKFFECQQELLDELERLGYFPIPEE